MKFVQKTTWNLPDLEYFRDELEWDVESMDDVINLIESRNEKELIQLLGYCLNYECYIEKE